MDAGYVFQFAARASSLVLFLVVVWLLPTACHANKVMVTEVVADALEVCVTVT